MEEKTLKATGHDLSGRYEQLYVMLLDAIPSSVLLIDKNMRIVSANRNFLEKGQRSLANTIGYRLEEVFPPVILDQMYITKRIRQVIENNQPAKGERMTYRAPGVPICIYYYSILPFAWQGQVEWAILLLEDVTEQVRLSEEVRRVERHLASIVESASDLVLSMDKKGRILTWNAAAERLSGYPDAEAREHDFTDFCADEDRKDIRNIFSRIDGERSQMKECPLRTKQAAFIPVSWVFSPLKDSSNQTAGVVAVGRDLTERRKFELELHQSQKFAALGVMAGGIAHEIRNPLAICSSSAQFLMEEDGTPEFRRECVENIYKGIQRASAIIENLLKYSHPSTTTRTTLVNLVSLIKETLTLATYHAKIHKIEMTASFPKESVMVQGVATLLQQVFMNLFLNAINAMTDGGRLGIDVKMDHPEEVRVQVTDTGCGISPKEIGNIFDPFYTTSPMGQGTGLGLSLCYSIVKEHRGIIEAESVEGRGSVFTVTLPARFVGGES